MKVRCVFKQESKVPDDLLALGYTPNSVFDITFDRVYTVYAMCIWQGMLHYLILDDEDPGPDWYPWRVFEVVDSRLPCSWQFGFIGGTAESPLQPIWGYGDLVLDRGKHYVDLIEREPQALGVFADRQNEIDSEEAELG